MNSSRHTYVFVNRQVQRGLSLVELMISITIGLLILSVLTTLFVNQSRTRSELDKSNRMVDNGRYALEVMAENLRVAGFYGNYTPSGTPTATPDPCNVTTITSAATNLNVLLHHVQGYNATSGTGATSQISSADLALAAACNFTYTAGSTTTLKPGSDILVLRRASTSSIAATAAVAATTYLQVSNCASDSVSYQLATSSGTFSGFRNKDCSTTVSLRPFIVQAYFVSPDNNAGDGIPTLKRIELVQSLPSDTTYPASKFWVTPLVEGIEYMQVDYGLDSSADGAADSYIAAPTTAQWPNVVSVRISIIARNTETSTGYTDTKSYTLGSAGTFGPFNDHYKRHAYTQVVRLVNPSGRLETP